MSLKINRSQPFFVSGDGILFDTHTDGSNLGTVVQPFFSIDIQVNKYSNFSFLN